MWEPDVDNEGKKYDLIVNQFDNDRCKILREKIYLNFFIEGLSPREHILDVGCGMGEPIAQYFIERDFKITGIDASHQMLALAKQRFPDMEWLYGDMREIKLTGQYDAVIAYDSFFHLPITDQIRMLEQFSHWLKKKGKLLISTGAQEGEVINSNMHGYPFSYFSMSPENYINCLETNHFKILLNQEDQPHHRIWIAQKY